MLPTNAILCSANIARYDESLTRRVYLKVPDCGTELWGFSEEKGAFSCLYMRWQQLCHAAD